MRTTEEQRQRYRRIGAVIVSALTFLIIAAVLLLIFSAVIYKLQPPTAVFTLFANVILAAACFAGARALSRRQKKGGIALGLKFAAVVIVIVTVLTILTSSSFTLGGFISKSIIILLSSVIGGIAGVQ
ncbi:MAG: TIGR04086 family membrane protein [Ruminococcus sp.]|jgi:putative membrane protein (TIGR04086 family)|nr:TIGR04086 family membrane protein [Ruminococcus sp.]